MFRWRNRYWITSPLWLGPFLIFWVNVQQLSQAGAFLGIEYRKVSKEKALRLGFENPYGSYVMDVLPNSGADKAGIQPFDYLFGIDEYRVNQQMDFQVFLDKYKTFDHAVIHYIRKGEVLETNITFQPRPESYTSGREMCEEPFLGISLDLSRPTEKGIRVEVVPHSTAEKMGIRKGNVVHRINDFLMFDWEDVKAAIHSLDVGEIITVTFDDYGTIKKEYAPLQSYCDTKFSKDESSNTNPSTFSFQPQSLEIELLDVREILEINQDNKIGLPTQQNLYIDDPTLNLKETKVLLDLYLPNPAETIIQIFNEQGRIFYDYQNGKYQGNFHDEVEFFSNGQQTFYLFVQQNGRSNTYEIKIN